MNTSDISRNQAVHKLRFYLKSLTLATGSRWDSDNDAEVEMIVDYIIDAACQKMDEQQPAVQGQMFPQGDDLPLFTAPADVDQDEWITRLAQNIHDSQPDLFWPMPERDQVADIYYWLLDHDGALDTSAAGILALADQYAAQIDR